MSNTVKLRIDGQVVKAPRGSTILDAARGAGIHVPTLCHSPLLRPLENCRLCVVSVAGEKKYKAACSTLAEKDMDVTTQSPELQQTRKLLLELLLDTHYGDCVAPCTVKCPANVDIQGYLALIRHGEYREAVRLIKEKIPMPATIGRVCPHTCETVCRRHLVDEPININHCKRFVADYELKSGKRVLPLVPPPSGCKVAIIGGGPAGLSAAYYLRSLGHGATIYEAREKLGGMLRYGIPEYRLPKKLLDWEIEGILSLGVDVRTGVTWGKDFTLDDLKRDGYDALFLAIGAWAARSLGITGEELSGVVRGIDFLEQIERSPKQVSMAGCKVAVIGGGNVAIDAARTSLRLGAERVTILYRRSRNEMPASHEEIEAAQEEGVDIQFLVAPTRLTGNNGAVSDIEFIRMELGEPDASGRRRPVPVEGSEVLMPVDQVISAIGQYPDIPLPEMDASMSQLSLTRWSTIGGDPRSMHTGREMVFVGGDVFRGPDTVVAALADGRKAAHSLDRFFKAGKVEAEPLHFNISKGELSTIDREPFSVLKTMSREKMPELGVQKRLDSFVEVELGLSEEQAKREAGRCLVCGCSVAFDCRLRELMNEFQVDWRDQPSKKIHYQRVAAVDTHPFIALDPNKCIRCERCREACAMFQVSEAIELREWPRFNDRCVDCGLCVDLCPTGALMEKREGHAVDRLDWRSETTHCIHCGAGCRLDLKIKGEKLVWISDGSYTAPNWASTCKQGRFRIFDPIWFGDRVTQPALRKQGKMRQASWAKAVEAVLAGFGALVEDHGGRSIGALASPRATNEALYLLQRWMRTGWKSGNLDFPGRVECESVNEVLQQTGMAPGRGIELSGLNQAEGILVVGDGTGDVIPVVGTMLRRAVKARGAALWQLSNGGDTLSPFASEAVHSPSDQWSAMVKDLVRGLLKAGRISREALSRVGLDSKVLEDAETVTSGAGEGNWAALIEDLGKCGSFALVIPEILFAESGNRETARMLVQLAAAMGKEGSHEGCWVVPVSGQINATGALLMGVSPNRLPGLIALDNPAGRDRIQQLWQVATLPEETWASVEQALSERRLRGLFVQDAAALWAQDADKWTELLKDLEFLVLQESVPSPAVKLAHVVLPAAGFTEQAGTVFNVEHRLLSLNRVFDARGKSLADYEILMQIMAAQGIAFPREVAAIHQELAAILPAFSGV